MKTIISLGLASILVLSVWLGGHAQPEQPGAVGQEPAVSTESPENTGGTVQAGGRMMINFEGRVTQVEDGRVTLDSGKTVLIGDNTIVVDQDGTAAEIAADDFIQGYAADPDAAELEAVRILVSAL